LIKRIAFWVLCIILLNACAAGRKHTSDLVLEQNFLRHKAQFERLCAEVQTDKKLEMIGHNKLRYAGQSVSIGNNHAELVDIGRLGFTKDRWIMYQHYLENLGVAQITTGENGYIEFRADGASLGNGDSCKGYGYSIAQPDNIKASLDSYRISENDKDRFGNYVVFRPIGGNWYLYLSVSR
jgi:hypothetical protein